MTSKPTVHALDMDFLGIPNAIAGYLIPHKYGGVLVECGPGSTLRALETGLGAHGLTARDITDVLVSHIHLDHAGAAGWLARQGARIHVHHIGAPHLIHPEKLLRSASRIYGELMNALWGEFLPVPEEQIAVLHGNDEIEIEGLVFRALDTPGHADHHVVYLHEGICFTGDVGGVRMRRHTPSIAHLRIPTPPPEFHLEKWRESIQRLAEEEFTYIAPTHFGIFDDPGRHLAAVQAGLDEIEAWMEKFMPGNPTIETLEREITAWEKERALASGVDVQALPSYEKASPAWMSAAGIQRYWGKYRC
ncbi:MAG: MBL fold metallo-hydrolase [Chloroflexi bacterium]|nr:MBL fold metallo-hydrolase [Chloroflexota bacterium]